jgi:N-acetylmuramic acid 6-phosphate etherase
MVDVQASNSKLRDRARRIVVEATGASPDEAAQALSAAGGQAKTAIVMLLAGVTATEAHARLERSGGQVRGALQPPP